MTGTEGGRSLRELEESLHLCRTELAQVHAQLEAALEEKFAEARRADLATGRLEELAASLDQRLSRDGPRRRSGALWRRAADGPTADEDRQVELLQDTELLDGPWYLQQHPDVAATGLSPALHYLRLGAAAGWDPGPGFSTETYLAEHPEVARTGTNPLVHHLTADRS